MGFLKNLFIEEVPSENTIPDTVTETAYEQVSTPEVQFDDVNTNTLIEDIYVQNELYDTSKSIFKVEELVNSFPKEMVTEAKRSSVLATLGVFGLTATGVTLDGENRIEILNGVLSKITSDSETVVADKEAEIENLKMRIADLEKDIAEQQSETKSSTEIINTETARITALIKFIERGDK